MQTMNDKEITNLLVMDILKERRRERRWKNIRFALWFLLIVFIVWQMFSFTKGGVSPVANYVALVRIDGTIAPGKELSAEELIPVLHDAFTDKRALGVIININSPGGTAVQSSIIHDAILAFKKKYKKRVIVVGEDMLASGAYYVAVSSDRIYVNPNTITGSIGVIMKGFGFVDLLKKVGVERRVYVAGNNKDRLDPFLPQTADDQTKIKSVISEVHQNFIQAVMEGRKNKLHADPSVIFSGDFWSGQTALKLGLVDGLGNLLDVMNKEFKTSHYKEYNSSGHFLRFLTNQMSSAIDSISYLYV